jgi:hypothetical protein
MECHGFTREANNSFHEHNSRIRGFCEPNPDDVASLWRVPEVGQPVHSVDAMVLVGWHHAFANDSDRQQHELEHNHSDYNEHRYADQGATRLFADQNRLQPRG